MRRPSMVMVNDAPALLLDCGAIEGRDVLLEHVDKLVVERMIER